jgi:hypothetical protein
VSEWSGEREERGERRGERGGERREEGTRALDWTWTCCWGRRWQWRAGRVDEDEWDENDRERDERVERGGERERETSSGERRAVERERSGGDDGAVVSSGWLVSWVVTAVVETTGNCDARTETVTVVVGRRAIVGEETKKKTK